MRFLLEFSRGTKSQELVTTPPRTTSGWRRILESFGGAWQRNVECTQGELVCYPTLYACIMRIATDMGRLPFCLKQKQQTGIWSEVENNSYSPVLRKPNPWQTAQQFRELWAVSKLTQGNAYALKRRDARNVVTALYILDPCRVQPMVTQSGTVYYKLQTDPLNTLPTNYPGDLLLVPASEIIHDRCITIHHPLIGVPPLCAAYWPAVKNFKILKSSAEFFANNAQPGGILTAPAGMNDDDAKLIQEYWASAYSGQNAGKVAVIGADMKFTSFAMKGADSQLVEQMRYSDEQICQPFGIPPFKIGIGSLPANMDVDSINLLYYDGALSTHIEAMENLLDEGLSIPNNLGIWMDTEPLLRMDVGKQADVETKLVAGKIKTPDEGRSRFNLAPTGGGNTLWGQNQDYPLGMLADRATWDPNMQPPAPTPAPAPVPDPTAEEARQLRAELWQRKALEATREAINA
jgi:HK97 family phage portal protein